MGLDLQRNAQMRLDFLLVVLIIWVCLLPVGYLLLWKAAKSPVDDGAGCLGGMFGIPERREDAQARFRLVNIILLVLIGLAVLGAVFGGGGG